ncbi:MAG: hypothetical protein N2C14_00050 [Planctomycetales bacterium]
MRLNWLVVGRAAVSAAACFLAASVHAAEPSGSDKALFVASQTGQPVLAVCGAGG